MNDASEIIESDAVVIGAGPVGLFQVFQLGLLEIKTHVIDSLPYAGGQCMALYPDKPIYDIPAVPVCTGRELTASLLKQIEPFGATLHLGDEVGTVARQTDGRFLVQTTRGRIFLTKVVVIAGGVGAFQPRRLKVDGIDAFEARQLFYQRQPESIADQDVVIVGGDEAAVQAALDAVNGAAQARSVTLLHRRDVLQAPASSLAEMQALREAGLMRFEVGQITGFVEERQGSEGRQLTGVRVTDVDAATHVLPVNQLLVYLGLSPKLGPIAEWSLAMARKQLQVDTESFVTSEPGIFAVGDINTYPGKKKLIVCGFHECVLAAFGAAAVVFPERNTPLQYTTTSPRLHQLLGVTPIV